MAHEIENNKAFFVTDPAWHGLGHVLTDAPSIKDAWSMAYPHTLFKLSTQAIIESDSGTHTMPLTKTCAIIRDDGKEIGSVGPNFELVQPIEVFESFKPLLESGLVDLEAGGSLRDGSQMWALGKIKNSETTIKGDDTIKSYFLMYTGFDGSLRLGMSQTNVRVVCANTLALAMGRGTDYTFKHTKNIRYKIGDAISAVKTALAVVQEQTKAYQYLANKPTSLVQQEKYIESVLLTESEQEALNNGELSPRRKNIVEHVIELLDTQKGLEYVPAIRGTAWQAYNAISEYVTHEYGRTTDARLHGQWFGESAKLNQKALDLALAM